MTESRRPALQKLASDQRELLVELQSAFASREAVLLWCQRVAVRSLGNLPETWFRAVTMRPDILDALVGDEDVDTFRRGQLGDLALHRAFREAFHNTRQRANEYILNEDLIDDTENTNRINQVYSRIMRDTTSELEKLGLLQEGPEMRKAEATEPWMDAIAEAAQSDEDN
jgi:hypothetical protein